MERKGLKQLAQATHLVKGDGVIRDIDRGLPGDMVHRVRKALSKPELTRQRSNINFYEEVFAINGTNPAKERVRGDAHVMAEVKTNVIISDEFTFITELSYHLSSRYQRPVSSIVVTLHHGACMLFGGSFDPAYVMSVMALPSQLLPTTNKRNAALIQKHMEEAIGVTPARGIVRFVPTGEENLACNGKTMAGEIDELEKRYSFRGLTASTDDSTSIRSRKSKSSNKLDVKNSLQSFASFRALGSGQSNIHGPELTDPTSVDEPLSPVPGSPNMANDKSMTMDQMEQEKQQKAPRRRKSFVATIFGSRSGRAEHRQKLPTIAG